MKKFLNHFFPYDLGIDLGTANTLIYLQNEGIVLNEPSVVAIDKRKNQIKAIGSKAKEMIGRTPTSISAVRPMRDGVIADFEIVEKMIRFFINKVTSRNFMIRPKPRVVIGIPSDITEVERRAVIESCEQAGVRSVFPIEEPIAAAIGAVMPVNEPAGNMIVDIGGGTTEIAVISLGDMVVQNSLRIGGNKFDNAIIDYMREAHNLNIGDRTAERIKKEFANLVNYNSTEKYFVKGRDAITGLPRTTGITKIDVREALESPINQIISRIKMTFDQTPPELSSDIIDRGIVLSGGGCLLKGLKEYISQETGVPVIEAIDPLYCVVNGTGKYLHNKMVEKQMYQ